MVRLPRAPSIDNTLARFGMVWSWRVAVCLIGVALLNAGCTTLQSSQLSPDAIRAGIRDGYLVQVGDEIGLVTADGLEQVIRVLAVDADTIRGEASVGGEVVIAVADVLALRTPQVEPVRSTFVALGSTAVLSTLAFLLLLVMVC